MGCTLPPPQKKGGDDENEECINEIDQQALVKQVQTGPFDCIDKNFYGYKHSILVLFHGDLFTLMNLNQISKSMK